jgi:hypothetical protein
MSVDQEQLQNHAYERPIPYEPTDIFEPFPFGMQFLGEGYLQPAASPFPFTRRQMESKCVEIRRSQVAKKWTFLLQRQTKNARLKKGAKHTLAGLPF